MNNNLYEAVGHEKWVNHKIGDKYKMDGDT